MENNIKEIISKEIINWADNISLTKGYDEDIEKLVKRLQDHISDIFDKLGAEKMELMAYIENIRNMAHEKYPHKDIIRSCEKALKK